MTYEQYKATLIRDNGSEEYRWFAIPADQSPVAVARREFDLCRTAGTITKVGTTITFDAASGAFRLVIAPWEDR